MKHFSVAIDGPSGAGKSTISRAIARKFGFTYVDTGAIYRAVGLFALRNGVLSKDSLAVEALLADIDIKIRYEDGVQRILLNGEDVSDDIRTPEVSIYASDVSAMPPVRSFLLDMQRAFAKTQNVIMDGRDIGTVVIPDADVKIFLTATPEERAKRRYKELVLRGGTVDYQNVLADMIYRDKNDSSRSVAPLCMAKDAIELDTTNLTFEECVLAISRIVKDRMDHGV